MKSRQNSLVGMLVLLVTLFGAAAPAEDAAQAPSDEDQASVVGCLRSINTAETFYAKTYNTGFSPTLKALSVPDQGTDYTASAAGLIDASLGSGKRSGYVFTYKPGSADAHGKVSAYTVSARPVKWQKGVRNFYTDQTGVIRSTTENRSASAQDPDVDK